MLRTLAVRHVFEGPEPESSIHPGCKRHITGRLGFGQGICLGLRKAETPGLMAWRRGLEGRGRGIRSPGATGLSLHTQKTFERITIQKNR